MCPELRQNQQGDYSLKKSGETNHKVVSHKSLCDQVLARKIQNFESPVIAAAATIRPSRIKQAALS